MLETLEAWDKALFFLMNGDAGPTMDRIMELVSEKLFWIPLYLLFLYLLFRSYGVKGVLLSLLAVAVLITLTDQTSVQLFKFQFERLRPCKAFEDLINNPVACGGPFGFVSSHAANFFGLVTFLFFSLRHRYPRIGLFLFPWAALIGYSRIYLGKHYPADVVGGAILGILIGYLVHRLFLWILDRVRTKGRRQA